MKNKSTTLVTTVLISFLIFFLANCSPINGERNSATILILIPDTGPASEYAKYSRIGFQMAQKTLSENNSNNINLIFADTKSNPKEGVSAFQQAIAVEKPDIIVSLLSSVTKAVAPMAVELNIPLIANAVAAPNIANPDQGVFRVFPTSSEISQIAATEIHQSGAKSSAVVYVNDEYGIGSKSTFERAAKDFGLEITTAEPFSVIEKDFRNQWKRLLEKSPESVFIAGYGPGYISVLSQLTETNYSGLIITDFTLSAPPVLSAVSGIKNETKIVLPVVPSEFKQAVSNEFPEAAYFVNIISAYDSIILAAEAIAHSNKNPEISAAESMLLVSPQTGSITDLKFNANGDVIYPIEIKNLKSFIDQR